MLSENEQLKFKEGIELFNKQEFFDCHEILEEVWNKQAEPERQLTQGIIQIAVAYYHALRGNTPGAIKLLRRGIPRVKPFLPESAALQLSHFLNLVEQDLASLENWTANSQSLNIPKIIMSKR